MTPKILPEGSAKLRRVGREAGGLLFHSLCGSVERKKALEVGGPSFDRFYLFLEVEYEAAKLRWAGRGAQRPVCGGSEFKKTGARSARARTRGQNPLVREYQLMTDKDQTAFTGGGH